MVNEKEFDDFASRCSGIVTADDWRKMLNEAEAMEDDEQAASAVEYLVQYAPSEIQAEFEAAQEQGEE